MTFPPARHCSFLADRSHTPSGVTIWSRMTQKGRSSFRWLATQLTLSAPHQPDSQARSGPPQASEFAIDPQVVSTSMVDLRSTSGERAKLLAVLCSLPLRTLRARR